MNRELAEKIVAAAEAANVDRWYVRRPTPEMIERFGDQGLHPFIEQAKQKGEAIGVEVLAEDYSGNDDLREAHLAVIMLAAENLKDLCEFYLAHAEPELDHASKDCDLAGNDGHIDCTPTARMLEAARRGF